MATTNRARAAVLGASQPAVEPESLPSPDVAPVAGVVALRPQQSAPSARGSMPDKILYAKALAEASLLPKAYQRQPGNVLLAVEMGEALGIHPFVAIQSVHVIEGKPTASAALISALVRRAGHKLRVTGDDTKATAQIIRSDDPDFVYECTWTLDRARVAGLAGKGVWKSYPAAMLKARAITEVARDACQEALSGVQYTPEELGIQVDGDGEPVSYSVARGDQVAEPEPLKAEIVAPGRDWTAEVDAAGTVEKCRALYREANDAGEMDDALVEQIAARAAELGLVDTATGEIGEPDPRDKDWPEVAEPGDGES